jgi:hypothetical protein
MMEVKTAQGLICSMSSQSNSGRRIAGLLAAGPTVDTDFSSGMAGWERSSGNDIRTKT